LYRYFILHKPFNMLSQFVSDKPLPTITDLPFHFPEGTHAIGRLDKDSEGLLLLTTNKRITKLLFQGAIPHARTYWVKVERDVQAQQLLQLQQGVSIRIRGGQYWTTTPCHVSIIEEPKNLINIPERVHIRGKYTWLCISMTEGKYRQIRKMVAAVGHKCKRLIRVSIDGLQLGDLPSASFIELSEDVFFEKLQLKKQL
jgi:23S rRNA pseudouridine2457 synthase